MSTRAIVYITSVVIAGAAVLSNAILGWTSESLPAFSALMLLTLVLSALKISLPRITGTISGGFLPVLVGIALLPASHAVLLGAVSAVVQTMWRARVRPQPVQVAFNVAVLAISAMAAWQVPRLLELTSVAAVLTIAVIVNYLVDVLMVSTVLCLVEEKPLSNILDNCNFWSLPYYAGGALIAAGVTASGSSPYWPAVLLTIPMMYALYRFYTEFVNVLTRK
jgi:hypothetical protein